MKPVQDMLVNEVCLICLEATSLALLNLSGEGRVLHYLKEDRKGDL